MRLILLTARAKAILTLPNRSSPRSFSSLCRKPNLVPNFSFSIVFQRDSGTPQRPWDAVSIVQGSAGFAVSKCMSSVSSPAAEWSDAVPGGNRVDLVELVEEKEAEEEEASDVPPTAIPVRAFFFSTSVDLRSLVEQNKQNFIPPSSRMTNYVVLRFGDLKPDVSGVKSSQYELVVYGEEVPRNVVINLLSMTDFWFKL